MDSRRMAGAVAGGLVAGLGITALLMAGERKSGEPSDRHAQRESRRIRVGHGAGCKVASRR